MGTTLNKLEYLDETKGQIKTALNQFNAGITEEDTFRSYVDKINNIYDNWEKVTGEGTNITLNDTKKAKLNFEDDIVGYGDTKQDSYEGYNILENKMANSVTQNGITYTKRTDGSVLVNGTASGNSYCIISNGYNSHEVSNSLANYTMPLFTIQSNHYCTPQNDLTSVTMQYRLTDGNYKSYSNIANNDEVGLVYLQVNNGVTINNLIVYPMIINGSSETKPFEKYCGGIPSPNPNYPQNIQVVTGEQEVKIENVNLFDGIFTNGIRLNATTGAEESNANSSVSGYIPIDFIKNTNYYLSGLLNTMHSTIWAYNSNKQGLHRTANELRTAIGLTSSSFVGGTAQGTGDIAYIRINMRIESGDTGTLSDLANANIQLELGSSATPYTPHQEQTQTISLGDLELAKIGSYQDYIYYDNGKWYKYGAIGKVIYNGSEAWEQNTTTLGYRYRVTQGEIKPNADDSTIASIYSNYFRATSPDRLYNNDNYSISNFSGTSHVIIIACIDSNTDTLEKWKTWLSTHNTMVYYVLATASSTEITDTTLLSDLNNIKENAMSYSGTTNILISGDLPMILKVNALKKGGN